MVCSEYLLALGLMVLAGSIDAFSPAFNQGVLHRFGRIPKPAAFHNTRISRSLKNQDRFYRSLRTTRSAANFKMSLFSFPSKDDDEEVGQTFFPAVDRIVAIGDVHGDVNALRSCLQIAGLVDSSDRWTGGTTHLVQLGDILDRGDTERSCIDLLFSLQAEARAAGGNVHILLGNHEIMNVDHDFRYVTRASWDGWAGAGDGAWGRRQRLGDVFATLGYPPHQRERVAAFRPGGAVARRLARMPVAVRVGDALFVHAGARLRHVAYGLERMNAEAAAWLRGHGPRPAVLDEDDSPLWARQYSVPAVKPAAERELENVLRALNCQRMVVGHTPQARAARAAPGPRRPLNQFAACSCPLLASTLAPSPPPRGCSGGCARPPAIAVPLRCSQLSSVKSSRSSSPSTGTKALISLSPSLQYSHAFSSLLSRPPHLAAAARHRLLPTNPVFPLPSSFLDLSISRCILSCLTGTAPSFS